MQPQQQQQHAYDSYQLYGHYSEKEPQQKPDQRCQLAVGPSV